MEENEVEVCFVSDAELEVEKNENASVEVENKGNGVEGNDGNERLDRGILGNKVICVSDVELEVEKNENACVELDNKGNEVEGNDGNERLDRGILGNTMIFMSGLMGLCVLCGKGFVVGLSIGAILLVLFEFVVNLVVFQWVRGCLDVLKMLNVLNLRWVFDGVSWRGGGGGSGDVGFDHGVDERDGCGLDVSDSVGKGEIEEVIESNDVCEMTENSDFDGASECGNVSSQRGSDEERGGEKEGECCKMVDENGKRKKGKKFWKRCMFRHISKKMKDTKLGKETHQQTTCIVSNSGEFDEEGEREKVVERRMEEFGNGGNGSSHIGKRFHRQNIATKSCRMVVYPGLNFECLGVIAIALVGLIDSRMLALILTLISCVGFMLARRL